MAELHSHSCKLSSLLEAVPTIEDAERVADLFAQASDSSRLRIIWLLCHCEECVTDIAAAVGMSAPAVSHHLRILRQCGLITCRRFGKEALYTLADTDEAHLLHNMIENVLSVKCPNCNLA